MRHLPSLVSIIIPTYNRAHLILETLESVKNQTYTHWECIIVDDGSTDNTTEVVHNYIQSDNRFQFHKRPHFHKPGGNGARNYGFTLAKGDYVNWFDSDDLMEIDRLDKIIKIFENDQYDIIIDKYSNFQDIDCITSEPAFEKNVTVNYKNYIKHNCFWGTINLVGKIEHFIDFTFNENLKSGQEYNFFSNVLSRYSNLKLYYLNEVLCFRRLHTDSIQQIQNANSLLRLKNKFNCYYQTYLDCQCYLEKDEKIFLLIKILSLHGNLLIHRDNIFSNSYILNTLKKDLGTINFYIFKTSFTIIAILHKGASLNSKLTNLILNENRG